MGIPHSRRDGTSLLHRSHGPRGNAYRIVNLIAHSQIPPFALPRGAWERGNHYSCSSDLRSRHEACRIPDATGRRCYIDPTVPVGMHTGLGISSFIHRNHHWRYHAERGNEGIITLVAATSGRVMRHAAFPTRRDVAATTASPYRPHRGLLRGAHFVAADYVSDRTAGWDEPGPRRRSESQRDAQITLFP